MILNMPAVAATILLLAARPAMARTPEAPPEHGASSSVIDLRALGAACDGVTDDTAAGLAAFTQAASQPYGALIQVPPGRCVFRTAMSLVLASGSVTIRGVNAGTSELLFTGGGDGIDITLRSGGWWTRNIAAGQTGSSVHVENLGLLTTAAGTGTAISVAGDTRTGRPGANPSFADLAIHGADAAQGWARGIYSFQAGEADYDRIKWIGINQSSSGIGIEIAGTHGTSESCVHIIRDYRATFFDTALKIDDGVQGVTVDNMNASAGNIAIDWTVPTAEDALTVKGGQFGAARYGIRTANVDDVIVVGNYFLNPAGATAARIENGGLAVLAGNTIRGDAGLENGFYLSKDQSVPAQYGAVINDNVFANLGGFGIGFGPGFTGSVTVTGNDFSAVRTVWGGTMPRYAAIGVNTIAGGAQLGAGGALSIHGTGDISAGHLQDADLRDTTVSPGMTITEPAFAAGDSLSCKTATLSGVTLVLPPHPANMQTFKVVPDCAITGFTLRTADGTGFADGLGAARPLRSPGLALIFKASGNAWYPWN